MRNSAGDGKHCFMPNVSRLRITGYKNLIHSLSSKQETMDDQPKLERMLNLLLTLSGSRNFTLAQLSERFSMSERTLMRYLATFRNVGFIVECRDGAYSIPRVEKPFKSIGDLLHFSEEEAYILTNAIHSIDDNNLLKTNLVNKLYSLYNFDRVAETVVKPENISTVHNLISAIREKKQVLLRRYRSSHGNLVRDRLVEPFDFTTNYQFVWAFEPESRCCKLFKTSRIGEVQALDKGFENEAYHEKEPMDVFRISSKEQVRVILRLSLRAYNLLLEEYPLAEKYVTATDDNLWQFDGQVCGFEGVGRFVMGLCDETEVVEPEELKDYLRKKIKNFIPKI
ncbi:MAG TPA: WYL domain-containing protein [Bacteroidales bacterium]|nr:WYL domain-containing protein [Bacteroidales bacterium]HPT02175.1 WYL domain-containing protein [Bacteroidales bacterium]